MKVAVESLTDEEAGAATHDGVEPEETDAVT